ncbi:MAG: ADP-ribosylglycohydrolase family protein [Lachnospiraceae bacterium]|nr:ADP-ribosylglycohydrolase family protein [Lachnospiraceae bacterium]
MYGAILGDIVGSRFEFDRGPWTKDFEFVTDGCSWTDDSVMTVAVAEALLNAGKDASVDTIRIECIKSMKKWGRKYPRAGYGANFIHWILTDDPTPYNSLGNGSAMRLSAAGWLYDSLERTREVAKATAEVSHNHPEGIKGAECTASVIFLGRTGASKEEIKEYVITEFGYDISKTVNEVRPFHRHEETCMDALPKALISFFEGESYEDTVRNAVSLGGDTDTIAAIAGAMAEAFYDMPLLLRKTCIMNVAEDMSEVMESFDKAIGRVNERNDHSDDYADIE